MKDMELVSVKMNRSDRLRLYSQITARMDELGLPADYGRLGLGFELPPDWPMDQDSDVTVAKLVVLAVRLKMKIEITDLNFISIKED